MKATLRYGEPVEPVLGASSTLAGIAPLEPLELDETIDAAAAGVPVAPVAVEAGSTIGAAGRTTVLPRRRSPSAALPELRPRFDRVRLLGEGGMGQVELVRDNDIRRTVAVKRLHGEVQSEQALLRFADEVRIVGQLEHPAIVPVYDVGRDESGQVYLVMKHLNGETMEEIIAKLQAGDPTYVAKYTIEYRIHLFLAVLDAIRYAHARGVIHRDLKPANVMIGPFGEVTVLDWGIAKPIRRKSDAKQDVEPLERTLVDTAEKRLQETQLGALAGTPLYMSPEQAAGRNDELDERSDVYSLSVVLYEWLTLEHPLKSEKTITEVLAAIISGKPGTGELSTRAVLGGVSPQWVGVMMHGLERDREVRTQSVEAMEKELTAVVEGRVPVVCHVTLTKRLMAEFSHWIDRNPRAFSLLFVLGVVGVLCALGYGGYRLVR